MSLNFFSLVSLFRNYFGELILTPLFNPMVAPSKSALCPLSLQHTAQGEFSTGRRGCGAHGEPGSGPQRAARLLSLRFGAACAHGAHPIRRVRTRCTNEGDVRRASPWAVPGVLELFRNFFHAGGMGGCGGLLHRLGSW